MADITLSRPSAQTRQVVSSAADDRFVFDFSTGDATLSRDGDNLIMTFDDGGALELTDFYTTYNKDNVPDFVVDGAEISGADFFTAMNEPDLMPAAGPASPQDQGSRHDADWTNSVLYGGIDSLGGLDLGFERTEEVVDDLSGLGMDGGNAPLSAERYGESILPAEPEPNVPGNSDDNQNHGVTVTPGVVTGAQHILYEKYLPEGTAAGEGELTVAGSLHIEAPDGVANISIGGVTVWANGELDSAVIDIPGGKLEVVNFDPATGQLDYEVQLTERLEHDGEEGEGERLHHDFTVTVTDTDGDSGSSVIRVAIEDDAPTVHLEQTGSGEYGKASVIGTLSRNYGADGEAADGSLSLLLDGKAASEMNDGMFTFDGIGTIKIEENGDIVFTPVAGSGVGASHTLGVTITDGDNDPAKDEITFSVAKTDISKLTGHAESSDADFITRDSHTVTVEGLPDGAALVNGIYEGTYGTITVKDGTISYLQDKKTFDHSVAGEEAAGKDVTEGADQISVSVRLGDGSETSFTVSVDITDDVPYGGSVRHDVARGDVIKGNIFDPDSDNPATAGADGLARVEWKLPEGWKWADGSTGPGSGTALREDYPDVSVNLEDDGSYTFTALGNLAGIGDSIAFDHIIHDSDGDWSEGKLDFNPSAKGDISPLPAELEVTVSEAALPDGSQNLPDADGKEIGVNATLKIPEGYEVVGGGAEGTYGKIVQNEDGSWSYQLTKQFDNSDAINDKMGQDTVTITLKDNQGNEYKVDVKVSILDDEPVMERIGAEEVSVEPGTETLFPEGKFDFTFGGHDKFTDYDNVALGMANENGWEVRWGDDWSKAPSAEHASGLHVSGWMYTYTEGNGQIILTPGENPLQVLYSDSQSKVDDKGKVDAGLQDGLTVGDPNPANDGSSSSLEIGAAPNGTTAEGLRFDLGDKIAHSVTVKLGAFFSAGSQNDAGYKYDPISERALLTFYDKNGNIVKQMEVQADSQDGQYTQSIDCYVAGGFSSFVVSALDNVKWAQEHDITYTGNADSDFVVQSVEFHKIIGTATGTVEVMSGADGLHASMNGYAALFDLEAMQSVIQDAFDGKATLEPDGEAGFLVKAGDTILFAAEIDQKGTWTLTQFESFEKPINLKFYTQDGDGDKEQTSVSVNLYQGAEPEMQAVAYGGTVDGSNDDLLYALGSAREDSAGNDALFDDSGEELIFYDKSDYLVQGGSGIDFLLSGKDDNLHLNEILANTDTNEGPLVSGVEVLLKGDGIGMLTSLEELEDYGIKVDGDRLMLGEGWKLDGEHYTYKEDSLILETTLTDPVVEDGTIVFENPSQTDELFTDALGISTVDDATEEALRVAINNMQADIGGC